MAAQNSPTRVRVAIATVCVLTPPGDGTGAVNAVCQTARRASGRRTQQDHGHATESLPLLSASPSDRRSDGAQQTDTFGLSLGWRGQPDRAVEYTTEAL